MDTQSATQVLGQFLLVALLVERIVAVGTKLLTPNARTAAEDSLAPQPDPWDSWTKVQVVSAFLITLIICSVYQLDLFSKLLITKPTNAENQTTILTYFGYFLTSVVVAGGSAGIQKILAAISANAKASKAQAKARIAEARACIAALRA
jgi:hypothetical protein